jgi:hypothetical protein
LKTRGYRKGAERWIDYAAFSPDGTKIVTSAQVAEVWDAESGELLKGIGGHNEWIRSAQFDTSSQFIYSKEDGIKKWDVKEGNIVRSIPFDGDCLDMNFENDLVIFHKNSLLTLYDLENEKEIFSWVAIDSTDYLVKTPDGYYLATKNALKWISFKLNNKTYSFEQFDLKYNRPDIVLSRLGRASQDLIDAYHQAYIKRIKRMGFTEEQLSGEFHVPETQIENFEYMPVIDESEIELELNFNDSKYNLDRYNIWINDVPVFGMYGKSLRGEQSNTYSVNETISLSKGDNKIQVSCLNEKGAESYKETEFITYEPKKSEKPSLYVVAVSVSEYQDKSMNLEYSVKDGREIAELYSQMSSGKYANVYVDTLFNESATTENLLGVKEHLMQSHVDDEVILFVSGHGLLDENLDFYFASYNVDFNNPSVNGISYDVLEGLLDSIPARKKLMLMDACHSGEIDKEDTEIASDTVILADGQKSGLKTYSYRGTTFGQNGDTEKLGLKNSFDLMQELFANLKRGSGAVVISAAGGMGYALEGAQWNNGVFTYSILDGLYNGHADVNGDEQVSVSELRTFVIQEVDRLTNGRQQPTCRQENLEFDWRVW